MLKESREGTFDYQRLSKDEMSKRNIIGRLIGICADFINPTRNGRKYSEDLWETVFSNDVMKEKIENHVCFGELGHPADREEVDMDKVAICLAEVPTKGDDGKLHAVFDILDTPNGRILKTMCEYGSNIGVSSRGSGELFTDENGDEAVDPESYTCECFDAVLIPAVESARLQYVTESLDKKKRNKTLRQKLSEELEKASESDKKIISETLQALDINLEEAAKMESINEAKIVTKGSTLEPEQEYEVLEVGYDRSSGSKLFKVRTIDGGVKWIKDSEVKYDISAEPVATEEPEEKHDDSYEDVPHTRNFDDVHSEPTPEEIPDEAPVETPVEAPVDAEPEFEEGLNKNDKDLLSSVTGGVSAKDFVDKMKNESRFDSRERDRKLERECNNESCTDKEVVNEDVGNSKDLVNQLQEALLKNSALEKDNLSLQEKLSVCNAKESSLLEEIKRYKGATISLSEAAMKVSENESLIESLNATLNEKTSLLESNEKLISNLKANNESLKMKNESLELEVNQLKSLNENLTKLKESLDKQNATLVKYKKALAESKKQILEIKAESYGLNVDDVKSKLNESYKVSDIDSVCEDLVRLKNKMNKLPFRINENTRVSVHTPSTSLGTNSYESDDDVSDYLYSLIK